MSYDNWKTTNPADEFLASYDDRCRWSSYNSVKRMLEAELVGHERLNDDDDTTEHKKQSASFLPCS